MSLLPARLVKDGVERRDLDFFFLSFQEGKKSITGSEEARETKGD
jgi:hypothetical protein